MEMDGTMAPACAETPPPLEEPARDDLASPRESIILGLISQSREVSSAWSVVSGWSLSGRLDAAALDAGLRVVQLRHDALRTYFPTTAGTCGRWRRRPLPW